MNFNSMNGDFVKIEYGMNETYIERTDNYNMIFSKSLLWVDMMKFMMACELNCDDFDTLLWWMWAIYIMETIVWKYLGQIHTLFR